MDEKKVKELIAEHHEAHIEAVKEAVRAESVKLAEAIVSDFASYKQGLERFNENLQAEHAKMKEMADMVNNHEMLLAEYRKVWQENFENLSKLVNQQTLIIEAMRTVLLPSAVN